MTGTVHVTTLVAADPDRCFRAFVERTELWWRREPRFRFRTDGPPGTLVLQAREGGQVLERLDDGTESVRGEVLAFEPPARLRFRWQVRDAATEVEVRFEREGEGTRVSVTHSGLGELGPADKNLFGIRWGELLLAMRRLA